jgi:hypothetical protein
MAAFAVFFVLFLAAGFFAAGFVGSGDSSVVVFFARGMSEWCCRVFG